MAARGEILQGVPWSLDLAFATRNPATGCFTGSLCGGHSRIPPWAKLTISMTSRPGDRYSMATSLGFLRLNSEGDCCFCFSFFFCLCRSAKPQDHIRRIDLAINDVLAEFLNLPVLFRTRTATTPPQRTFLRPLDRSPVGRQAEHGSLQGRQPSGCHPHCLLLELISH